MYIREIPRDLFNEAGLLKSLGRISLLILDRIAPHNLQMRHTNVSHGFLIDQDQSSGDISCGNVTLSRHKGKPPYYDVTRLFNSREPWAVYVCDYDADDGDDVLILDEDGNLTPEFVQWCSAALP